MPPPIHSEAPRPKETPKNRSRSRWRASLGEIVGDQRIGGGIGAGLADPDAHPRRRELGEVDGEAAEDRHQRPAEQAERHQLAAQPHVGDAAQGNAEQRIEHRESGAVEQADLRIRQAEIGFDRTGKDGEDLPVDQAECQRRGEDGEDVPAVAPGSRWRCVPTHRSPNGPVPGLAGETAFWSVQAWIAAPFLASSSEWRLMA